MTSAGKDCGGVIGGYPDPLWSSKYKSRRGREYPWSEMLILFLIVSASAVMRYSLCCEAMKRRDSLILGFLTPLACALAALAGFGIAALSPSAVASSFFIGNPLSFDVLIMVLASGLLGPGAFSLDAHLFGRRKIVIPRSPHSQASLSSPSLPSNSSPPYSAASSSSRPPGSSPSRPPLA
jgi:hypothetical protein